MKKNIYRWIALYLFCGTAYSQWKLDSPLHESICVGIDYILKHEYNKADSVFKLISFKNPNHPVGYLYQVAVMQSRTIDLGVPIERKPFDSLLSMSRNLAESFASPWREYFLGTADGYDAFERSERGDWFGIAKFGSSSASEFEAVVKYDSTFFDAYTGLGTYYYWRSRKTEFLQWLPFVHDDRARGISMLELGAARSYYNRFAAITSLISIYFDSEDYRHAESLAREALKSYPSSRVFLWGLTSALDRQHKYKEAVAAYESLLVQLLTPGFSHPYDQIVCRLNLSKSKLALHDTTNVRQQLTALLAFENAKFPDSLSKRSKAKFNEAKEILISLDKKRP